jgi:hypothetical protein
MVSKEQDHVCYPNLSSCLGIAGGHQDIVEHQEQYAIHFNPVQAGVLQKRSRPEAWSALALPYFLISSFVTIGRNVVTLHLAADYGEWLQATTGIVLSTFFWPGRGSCSK